jgi:signal transduction histidine kinase
MRRTTRHDVERSVEPPEGPQDLPESDLRSAERSVRDSGLRIGGWVAVGLWISVSLVFASTSMQQGGDPNLWLPGYVGIGVTGAFLSLPVLYAGAAAGASRTRWRFLWIAVAALAAACAQSVADVAVLSAVSQALQPGAPKANWLASFRFNMMLYIWIYALYGTAVALVFALLKARGAERRLLQVQAAADRARLEALRLQINPHFLFNALNAAVSLIGLGRSADAEAVLLRLSDLFRSSLASPSGDVVSLEAEFEIIEAYLEIESIRFGERLTVRFDLPEGLRNAAWPHFLLQPLVENAIKHGTACTSLPTRVSVKAAADADTLVVSVENDPTPDIAAVRGGVGLSNTRERLAVLFGGQAELKTLSEGGKFIAEIRLPLTTVQP